MRNNQLFHQMHHSKVKMFNMRTPTVLMGPIFLMLLFASERIKPTSAIFNCFTPNMFKMNKGGQPTVYGPQHSGERAGWYPQSTPYPSYMSMGYNPMKMLFQPKWRTGSLFGPKKWMDWRMGANSNFYRPGYGYMGNIVAPGYQPGATYQLNDQISLPPFPSVQPSSLLQQPTSGSYAGSSSQQQQIQLNDGWSVPLGPYSQTSGLIPSRLPGAGGLQQQPISSSYDAYSVSPGANQQLVQPGKQQYTNANLMDPYGSGTKGGGSNKQQLSTTKNILVADGGYSSFDSYLMGSQLRRNNSYNQSANYNDNYLNVGGLGGYAYPEWYSGVSLLDSPAKIGHQLYKKNNNYYNNNSNNNLHRIMMAGI